MLVLNGDLCSRKRSLGKYLKEKFKYLYLSIRLNPRWGHQAGSVNQVLGLVFFLQFFSYCAMLVVLVADGLPLELSGPVDSIDTHSER